MRFLIISLIFIISCSEVTRDQKIELGKTLFENNSLYKENKYNKNLACANCHPMGNMNNAKTDQVPALTREWNTPSLWNVSHTAPYLWGGEHADLKVLTEALMNSFMKNAPSSDEVDAMVAYISSIPAPISPFLNTDGSMTESQKQGKLIFDGRGNCVSCHSGKWMVDGKKWFVKTKTNGDSIFIDTPSLLGMWDTAPYWHDGSMATIQDVFDLEKGHKWIRSTSFKVDPPLSTQEKKDLEAYLLSL